MRRAGVGSRMSAVRQRDGGSRQLLEHACGGLPLCLPGMAWQVNWHTRHSSMATEKITRGLKTMNRFSRMRYNRLSKIWRGRERDIARRRWCALRHLLSIRSWPPQACRQPVCAHSAACPARQHAQRTCQGMVELRTKPSRKAAGVDVAHLSCSRTTRANWPPME